MATRQNEHAQMHLFKLATHYYIAGRFAVINHFMPARTNLMHHAVEMFLKGTLSQASTLEELRNLGHNLNKIWAKFATALADARLASFDSAIRALHKFERLRYPDAVIQEGMVCRFELYREHIVPPEAGGVAAAGPPEYLLVL